MAWNDLKSFFGNLTAPVGNGRTSRPEDVAKVQQAMNGLSRYRHPDEEPNGILDRGLDRAVRNYQADRGLKRDGWLAPQGETAREIGKDLGLLRLASSSPSPGDGDAAAFYTEMTPGDAERSMRGYASSFRGIARLGQRWRLGDLGFGHAANNLDHYLGASGTPLKLSSHEVEAEPALRNAERANLRRIETLTFTANTRDKELNNLLKNLPERQAVDLKDNF